MREREEEGEKEKERKKEREQAATTTATTGCTHATVIIVSCHSLEQTSFISSLSHNFLLFS